MKAWIARDFDGTVYIYTCPPVKEDKLGEWVPKGEPYMSVVSEDELPLDINPKWLNTEPIEIEITIHRAKKED